MAAINPDVESWSFRERYAGLSQRLDVTTIAGVARDDCAVVELPNRLLVATSDFVNSQPIFLELGVGTYRDIGRYLVNTNLSDLCSTGAQPFGLLINIMWSRSESRSNFDELIDGIHDACESVSVQVLGGDTKLGSRTALNATALGYARSRSELMLMTNGRPGDGVWVSGPLGSCAAATLGLARHNMPEQWRAWASSRIARPTLPLGKSELVAGMGANAAGTDISDGLDADLFSLCRLSEVGADIDLADVPVEDEVAQLATILGTPPQEFAFTIGGDLQFIATIPDEHSPAMIRAGMHRIGTLRPGPVLLNRRNAEPRELTGGGHSDSRGLTFVEEIEALLGLRRDA